MTDKDHMDDAALDALFDAARRAPPEVPEALMMRVLADAEAAQPRRSGWRDWFAALGGLPGLGGLVTATCVGFWLGVAPPAGLPDLAGEVMGYGVGDDDAVLSPSVSGFGWDIEEG